MRRQLSEQAAQAVIEAQGAQRPVPGPLLPDVSAGDALQRHEGPDRGKSRGAVAHRRGYYYARPVSRVFFPLDEQLELWEHHWSESVVKYAVWLSGLVT